MHNRTIDANIDIMKGVWVDASVFIIGNIDATSKCDGAVTDGYFAVISKVDDRLYTFEAKRMEEFQVSTGGDKLFKRPDSICMRLRHRLIRKPVHPL